MLEAVDWSQTLFPIARKSVNSCGSDGEREVDLGMRIGVRMRRIMMTTERTMEPLLFCAGAPPL